MSKKKTSKLVKPGQLCTYADGAMKNLLLWRVSVENGCLGTITVPSGSLLMVLKKPGVGSRIKWFVKTQGIPFKSVVEVLYDGEVYLAWTSRVTPCEPCTLGK